MHASLQTLARAIDRVAKRRPKTKRLHTMCNALVQGQLFGAAACQRAPGEKDEAGILVARKIQQAAVMMMKRMKGEEGGRGASVFGRKGGGGRVSGRRETIELPRRLCDWNPELTVRLFLDWIIGMDDVGDCDGRPRLERRGYV